MRAKPGHFVWAVTGVATVHLHPGFVDHRRRMKPQRFALCLRREIDRQPTPHYASIPAALGIAETLVFPAVGRKQGLSAWIVKTGVLPTLETPIVGRIGVCASRRGQNTSTSRPAVPPQPSPRAEKRVVISCSVAERFLRRLLYPHYLGVRHRTLFQGQRCLCAERAYVCGAGSKWLLSENW